MSTIASVPHTPHTQCLPSPCLSSPGWVSEMQTSPGLRLSTSSPYLAKVAAGEALDHRPPYTKKGWEEGAVTLTYNKGRVQKYRENQKTGSS